MAINKNFQTFQQNASVIIRVKVMKCEQTFFYELKLVTDNLLLPSAVLTLCIYHY